MLILVVAAVPLVILALLLRWAIFVRVAVVRAPFCPVCGEARGRVLGVGERTGHPYFHCPHCGNDFEGDEPSRDDRRG